MTPNPPSCMLVTLGGTPEPILFSLDRLNPGGVVFFVSEQSAPAVRGILEGLKKPPSRHKVIRTPDPQSFNQCFLALHRGLPGILEEWGIEPRDLRVDFTGGTKVMSAAAALAVIESAGDFVYVGGTERTKGGVGVVVPLKEVLVRSENPWTAMAIPRAREGAAAFNRGAHAEAARLFEEIAGRLDKPEKALYAWLACLSRAYAAWDAVLYPEAAGHFKAAEKALAEVPGPLPRWARTLRDAVAKGAAFFDRLAKALPRDAEPCLDLLGNAHRCGTQRGRYFEAVILLQAAVEARARAFVPAGQELNFREIMEELARKGHQVGRYYQKHWKEVNANLLNLRNLNLHRGRPVSEEEFKRALKTTMDWLIVQPYELPQFPAIPL